MKKKSLLSRLLSKTPGAGEESSENREFVAEQLEARILYSAAPVEVEAPQADQEVVVDDNSSANFESADSFAEGEIPAVNSSASSGELVTLSSFDHLSSDEIESLANAAVERWKEADLTAEQIEALEAIEISMVDLEGLALGETEGTEIFLDWNAAGRDWFIDETPFDDDEFEFAESSTAFRDTDGDAQYGIDMLTVMMHEMGHVLGLEDIYQSAQDLNLMHWDLDEGQRITPVHGQAHGADPLSLEGVHQLNAVNPTGGDAAARGAALESDVSDIEGFLPVGYYNNTTVGTADADYEINLDAGVTYEIDSSLVIRNRTVNVVINGNGSTIDAQNLVRAFDIRDDSNVIINDLTIINGQVTSDGGGMYIDNANVTLNNVTFRNNVTTADGNSQGGAIYAQGHSTTITLLGDILFEDNISKGDGGALAIGQHVIVDGSAANSVTFTNNRSGFDLSGTNLDDDEHGGAIWAFDHADIKLHNVTMEDNSATGVGGGMYITNSADLVFTSDTATSLKDNFANDDGGGFYIADAATINLGNVNIENNTANLGNGGGFRSVHRETVVTISGGTLQSNTAGIGDDTGSGGGFWNQGTVNITGVDIQNNIAYDTGGGFYSGYEGAKVNLTDVNILTNTAEDSAGGFRVDNGDVIFQLSGNTETKIINNRVGVNLDGTGTETAIINDRAGGGFYANRRSNVEIASGIIQDNTSTGHGAGFWASDETTVKITNGKIDSNEISPTVANNDERGGGFWVSGESTVTLDSTDVTNNTAARQGGGFFVGGKSATVVINDAEISGNTGNNGLQNGVHGGGFYTEGSVNLDTVNISGNIVRGEGNEDNHGGGFATAGHGGIVTGTDVNITNNESWTHGGGWYGTDGAVYLTGGTISGNKVGGLGGTLAGDGNSNGVGAAAYLVSEGTAVLEGVTVENHTSESHGGAFYVATSHYLELGAGTVLQNNYAGIHTVNALGEGTIIVNGSNGGGFYATDDSRVKIDGATIQNNIAENEGGGFMAASDRNVIEIASGTIDSNTASSSNGGGFRNAGTVVFSGGGAVNITNNVTLKGDDGSGSADNVGAGFYTSGGSSLMVTGTLDNGITGTGREYTAGTAQITITGNTAFGRGGGFYLSDGDMDLRGASAGDINISKNGISTSAEVGGEKRGGGFWVSGGGRGANVNIENGKISENFTPNDGGGFYTRDGSTVTLTNTDILNNVAESQVVNYGGGGFHADSGEDLIIINGGKIEGNIAGSNNLGNIRVRGGGFLTSGKVELHNGVQILNNEVAESSTTGADRRGGGAAVDGTGWIHATDATFDGNKSFNVGAGIYTEGRITAEGAGLSVLNSSFTSTDQRREGAGVYFTGASSADWDGGSISGNVSTYHGAGVRVDGVADVTFTNVTISNNRTDHHATDTATNAVGAGIYAEGATRLTLIDSTVTANTAEGRGGGLYIDDTVLTLENSTISNNLAGVEFDAVANTFVRLTNANGNTISREGGGIWASGEAVINAVGGEISGNSAWGGGGLEFRNNVVAVFDGTSVKANVANQGGGFRSYNAVNLSFVNGASVEQNIAWNGTAGGGYTDNQSVFTLQDSTVQHNITQINGQFGSSDGADRVGAGLYLASDSQVLIERSSINENYAQGRGAGIYSTVDQDGSVQIIDSNITNNRAIRGGDSDLWRGRAAGIALQNNTGVIDITGSLIAGNIAAGDAAGVRIGRGTLNMDNSTVSGNIAGRDFAATTTVSLNDAGVGGSALAAINYIKAQSAADEANFYRSRNQSGGGIGAHSEADATVTVNLNHVTITGNESTGGDAGGVRQSISTGGSGTAYSRITIENSIIFNNYRDSDTNVPGVNPSIRDLQFTNDSNGSFVSVSEANIIGVSVSNGSAPSGITGNTAGIITVDPVLGALADNGGSTFTHSISAGGSAEDAATNSSVSFDQRGADRTGGIADLGAVELGASVPALTIVNVDKTTHGPIGEVATFTIDLSSGSSVSDLGVVVTGAGTTPAVTIAADPEVADRYFVSFTPEESGAHTVDISLDGGPVQRTFQFEAGTELTISDIDGLHGAVTAFNAGSTDLTVTLNASTTAYDFSAATDLSIGDLDITNADNILVLVGDGATAADTVIDAANLDRVFEVNSFSHLVLRNLTVKNGEVAEHGAGIRVSNAYVTLDNVIIEDNEGISNGDVNANRVGAGMYITGHSVVNANNVTIDSNTTHGRGGGFYIDHLSEINFTGDTVIKNNETTRTTDAQAHGGGFWASGTSKVNIEGNFDVVDNTTTSGGGAFFITDAAAIDGSGAASVDILRNNVTSNHTSSQWAAHGQGFWAYNNSEVKLANATIDSNGNSTIGQEGGGFRASQFARVEIDGGAITNNLTRTSGAGFRVSDMASVKLTDVEVSGNSAANNGSGGGFLSDAFTVVELDGGKLESNMANGSGDGAGFYSRGTVTITGVDIQNNETGGSNDAFGGAFFATGTRADINLTDVNILNNTAEDHGGGFWASDNAKVDFDLSSNSEVKISGNKIADSGNRNGRGGGFWASTQAQVNINAGSAGQSVDLNGNITNQHGGAFSAEGGHVTIVSGVKSEISGYDLTSAASDGKDSGVGAGFYVGTLGKVNITNVDIKNNTADTGGGGFFSSYQSEVNLTDVVISGNTANTQGSTSNNDNFRNGGGGFYSRGSVTLTDSSITDNIVLPGADVPVEGIRHNNRFDGGGFWAENKYGRIVLNDTDVTDNTAQGNGGGFAVTDVELVINTTGADISDTATLTQITGNQITSDARHGGGIYAEGTARLTLNGVNIENNSATNDGAGFMGTSDAVISVNDSVIHANTFADPDGTKTVANRDGAGFYVNSRATVNLTDSVIKDSTATSLGGGFRADGADTTVNALRTSFHNNASLNSHGGAMVISGKATITDSDFGTFAAGTHNQTIGSGNDNRIGGGIYQHGWGSNVTLNNTDINDQRSFGRGAAAYISNGTFTANNSDFKDNQILSSSRDGGAIWMGTNAIVNLNNSEISGNSATGVGGGIAIGDSNASNGARLNLDNVKIDNNTANSRGGGLWVSDTQSDIVIQNSEITNNQNIAGPNSYRESGGGLYITHATVVIEDSLISGNTASSGAETNQNREREGGGIRIDGSGANVTLTRTTVENNYGGEGAGIYNTGQLTLNDSLIRNNTSLTPGATVMARVGGGIFSDSSAENVFNNSVIEGNTSTSGGGGMYNGGRSLTTLNNTTFSNNRTYDIGDNDNRVGGAVQVTEDAKLIANKSLFDANEAHGRGGAIYNDGHTELYDSTISGNISVSDRGDESRGAGIWTSNINGNLIMDRSSVVNNVGAEHGAGIWAHEGDISIQNSTISGNTTGVAASFYNDAGSGSYQGTGGGVGGAMWASDRDQDGAYIRINNSTIAFNSATGSAGGIYSSNVPLFEIQNSIVYNNVQDIDSTSSNYDIQNRVTLIGDNIIGQHFGTALLGNTAGRLTSDPKLSILQNNGGPAQGANGTIGDADNSQTVTSEGFLTHFLETGSSAIDAVTGSDDILDDAADPLAVDAIGASRTGVGAAVDIGAIERPDTNPPAGGNDVATTNEDTLISIVARGVLLNDTDIEDAATALVVANFQGVSVAVANGSNSVRTRNGAVVVMSADGSYTYDPTGSEILGALNSGESIIDTFTYRVQDTDGLTNEATVSVTVTGVTDPPVVNTVDPVVTDEDSPVIVNVVDEEVVFQGELSPEYLADMNRSGYAVDIHEDLAIIGGNRGHQTEQVFIYRDTGGGNWQLEATLTNPDGIGSFDTFGFSVAIDSTNERAYVGARLDDDGGSNRGAVYFFENDGSGNWTSTQKIGVGDANDEMGYALDVDIASGTLIVGAAAEDTIPAGGTAGTDDYGAVYVFNYVNSDPANPYELFQTLNGYEGGLLSPFQNDDRFGEAVAIDGNTIVIGMDDADLNGNNSGAAFIYSRDPSDPANQWTIQTVLRGNEAFATDDQRDVDGGDRFGIDVDVSGDTVVIGSYLYEENNSRGDRGAVFVYKRTAGAGTDDVSDDVWTASQTIHGNLAGLTGAGVSNSDQFGISVAIDGDRLIVGAMGDDQGAGNSGSVFIFDRTDSSSDFDVDGVQRLNASDAQANSEFGRQVAISGSSYLVGAHLHDAVATAGVDNLPLVNYGRAYIYNGEVGAAGSEALLDLGASTFTEFSAQADFGFRMAIGGDIAVVGAPGGGKNTTDYDVGAGQAFVYQRNDQGTDDVADDTWQLLQVLRNLDDDNDDAFGVGVAVSKDGSTIAIGADTQEDGGSNQGAVYIYELEDGEYVHKGRIRAADRQSNDRFGRSVALNENGSVLAVGVFDDHSSGLADSGSVRVYDVIGRTWTDFFTNGSVEDPGDQDGEILLAPGGAESDEEFGRSVAISGNRIVVGEYLADDVPNNSGAAYVFEHNGTDWTTNVTTLPGALYPATNDDRFGRSVDIDGDTIVVGSYQDEADGGSNRGSATVFEWNGIAWVETALLEASDAGNNDNFGLSVAVDGDHIVVGAYREDTTATNAGAAYVYSRNSGGEWNELTKINAPAGSAANANFGRSVNISDGTIIIGAPEADVLRASGINQVRLGAAYMYQITPISDAGLITLTSASAAKGTASVNPDGTISFDPRGAFDDLDEGDFETVTVTYNLAGSEDLTATSTGTVTVTVTGVNDTPIAVDDSFTVGEDDASAVVGNVLSNDDDLDESATLTVDEADGDTANVGAQFTASGGGLVTVGANGDVTFDPNGSYESLADGETAVESFTYNVSDGLTQVVHSEKNGIIVGEATAFTNTDDYISVLESDVVANVNSMAGSRTGTFMQIPNGVGSSGSITVEDTNRPRFLEYKVNVASAGTYQLFIRATGYDGGSDSLYASIVEHQDNLTGGNPDWYRFFVGGDTNFTWSGTGEVESTSGGAGTEVPMEFTLTEGVHTLRIMTREDGAAVDAFALRRTDSTIPVSEFTGDVAGPAGATEGTVSITVTGSNDAPTTTANINQVVSYTEDDAGVALGDIVISDVDNNDQVTATLQLADNNAGLLTVGTFGSVTSTYDSGTGIWTAAGSVADVNAALADVSFTPAANYDQNTSISVTIDDGDEDGSGALTGTISLNVTAVNDAPVAADDSGLAVENGGAVVVDVTANDTDEENNVLSVIPESVTTSVSGASLTVVGNNISYDPSSTEAFESLAAGEVATDTFTYSITDNQESTLLSEDFESWAGPGSTSLNNFGLTQFGTASQVVQNAVWASDPFGSAGSGVWLQGNNPNQNGGFYQEVVGVVGGSYTFEGTFRIEPNFVSNGVTVALELIYLDSSGVELSRDTFDVGASGVPSGSFVSRSVNGTAVAGTATVRSQVSWTTDSNIEVGTQTAVLIDNMAVSGPAVSTATVTMTITGTNDAPVARDDGGFASIWELGIDNNSNIEFEQEGPTSNPAPGDPNAKDDDYYFAGTYAGVGVVVADEVQGDGINNGRGPQGFERALTNSDPVNRIHFNLPGDAADDNYRLLIDTVGSNFNSASFDFEVLLNGNQIYSSNMTSDGLLQIDFDGTYAVSGENTITLARTDSNGGWLVFDYLKLQSNYEVTEDGSTITQVGNVLGNDRDKDVNGTAPDDTITVIDVDSTAVASSGNTVITGIYGSLSIDANGAYTYTLDNGDADTDALGSGDVVTENFVYTISDGTETATANLSIQVNGTDDNTAPSINTAATVNVAENETSVIDVNATDPEGDTDGSGLTYTLTGGADQAKFSIDPNTGVLVFLNAPDYENPTDAGTDNVYDVQVTVTDSGGLTDTQDIAVTVTNIDGGLSIADAGALNEGDAGNTVFSFTVSRTGDTTGSSTATYTVSGNGANAATADDFAGGVFASGVVSFADGDTSKVITVNVSGDVTVETDEGFKVVLSAPATNATFVDDTGVATILNDEFVPAYYVDDDFSGTPGVTLVPDADHGENGPQGAVFGISAFDNIQDALTAAAGNGITKVIVNEGNYTGPISVPAGITLEITGPDTPQAVVITELSSEVGSFISIEGSSTLSIDATLEQTIAGTVTGTGSLVKTGTGILNLDGANSFSGGVLLNDGILVVGDSSALGAGTVTIEDSGDPVLQLTSGVNVANDIVISNVGGNKIISLDGSGAETAEISGNIVIDEVAVTNFDIRTGNGDELTLSGDISGAGRLSLVRTGVGDAGVVILSGNNTHIEGTEMNVQSTVRVESATALGAKAILEQATLEIGDGIVVDSSTPLEVSTTGNNKVLRLADGATSGEYAGAITINEVEDFSYFDVVTASGQTLTLSGNIDGPGRLNVVRNAAGDGGVVIISGDNSHDEGTEISTQTTLVVESATALGSQAILEGGSRLEIGDGVTVDSGTTLYVPDVGNNRILAMVAGSTSAGWDGPVVIDALTGSGGINDFDIVTGTGQTFTLSGNVSGDGRITVSGLVDGATPDVGVLVLSGDNTHLGGTFLDDNGTTAQVLSATALGASALMDGSYTNIEVGDGVVVTTPVTIGDLGSNKAIGLVSTATSGEYAGNILVEEIGVSNFDLEADTGQTLTVSGIISLENGGLAYVSKEGDGTVILTGANTYTSQTRINQGTLLVNGDNSAATGNTIVTSGGTLGGTGTVGGFTRVDAGGILAPGVNGVGTLTFNGAVDIDAALNVEVDGTNDTADRIDVTGTLNITNTTLNITDLNTADDAEYIIATYTGNLTGGTFAAVNGVPAGYSLVIDTANKEIKLDKQDPPVANDDVSTAVEAGGIANADTGTNPTGNVITGGTPDSDPDADATLTISEINGNSVGAGTTSADGSVVAGTYGNLTIGADGSYVYEVNQSNADGLDAGDTPTEVFTYTLSDEFGLTDTATLTVTVTGANDTPVAVNDTASATEAGGVANGTPGVDPAGNVITGGTADSDVDADAVLSISQIDGNAVGAGTNSANGTAVAGVYGTLTIGADGSYTYMVNQANADLLDDGDTPTEVFTYTLTDEIGATTNGTLTVTVNGSNDAPVAPDETANATEAGGIGNVGGVDPSGAVAMSDVDDTVTVTDISFGGVPFAGAANNGGSVSTATPIDGAYGTLTISPDGSYSYVINQAVADSLTEGQVVHDVFTYTSSDGTVSDSGTIDITITGDNDAADVAIGAGDTVPNPLPVEQGIPVQLVEEVTVADVDDSQLEEITVTISPVLDDLGNPVTLTDDIKDGSGNSLNRTDNPDGSITFTMTGPFTAAEVKSEIEGLKYLSPNGSLEDRTVAIRVGDGDDFSSPIVKTIELSPARNNFNGIQSVFRDLSDRMDNTTGNRTELFIGVGGSTFDSGSAFGLTSATRSTTPFVAGLATPGSLVHIRYFDASGNPVSKVVTADQAGNFAGSVEGGHSVTVIIERPIGQTGGRNVFVQGSFIFPDLDLSDKSDDEILGYYFPLNIESAQALQDSLTPGLN